MAGWHKSVCPMVGFTFLNQNHPIHVLISHWGNWPAGLSQGLSWSCYLLPEVVFFYLLAFACFWIARFVGAGTSDRSPLHCVPLRSQTADLQVDRHSMFDPWATESPMWIPGLIHWGKNPAIGSGDDLRLPTFEKEMKKYTVPWKPSSSLRSIFTFAHSENKGQLGHFGNISRNTTLLKGLEAKRTFWGLHTK